MIRGVGGATSHAALGSDLRGNCTRDGVTRTIADAAGNGITSGKSYGVVGMGLAALGKGAVHYERGLGARRVEPAGDRPARR